MDCSYHQKKFGPISSQKKTFGYAKKPAPEPIARLQLQLWLRLQLWLQLQLLEQAMLEYVVP